MSIFKFFYRQLFVTPPYPTQNLAGQTIIVTGANVGLGLECARHLVRMNAEKVILAVRTQSKGEEAKKSIEETTGRKGVVEVWSLDLSSYDSVIAFVKKAESLPRIDVVVENAGVAISDRFEVTAGNETTITTNVISTFLLALLILPKLRETATRYNITPRLCIVSSEVHVWASLPERKSPEIIKALNDKSKARMMDRYNVSKLLEVLYCRVLASKMTDSKKPQVTLNFLNPGLCHSQLSKGVVVSVLKFLLARTTEVGSRTLVAAVTAGHETHGQYMSDSVITPPSPFVLSEDGAKTQQRIYDEVNNQLEAIQPGIVANV